MSETVISVENLSKHYQLGVVSTSSTRRIGSNTLRDDVARWWANLRGQTDHCTDRSRPSMPPWSKQRDHAS